MRDETRADMRGERRRLLTLPGRFAVCRLDPRAPVPAAATNTDATTLLSLTRTADELSLVCPEEAAPTDAEARVERGWKALRVAGSMDFGEIGVLASLTEPLARAGISLFALSTFDTDYLLVREPDWPRALDALRAFGHDVVEHDRRKV